MRDTIYRQAAIKTLERKKDKNAKGDMGGFYNKIIQNDIDALMQLPSAQPEQKNEELLPDGTLHLFTDADLSKVGRVLVSQNGTHYGALYYADGEPKQGDAEFINWLLDEVWDDELWELNYRAFPELLCRRLVKAGWLKEEGGRYVRLDKQTGGD